jgi:hypothetical protein
LGDLKMRTIYKYALKPDSKGYIKGHITKILSVAMQQGILCVWAEVDDKAPEVTYSFIVIGTGWNLEPERGKPCVFDTYTFLGTVLPSPSLVFHVYYKIEEEEPKTKLNQSALKRLI